MSATNNDKVTKEVALKEVNKWLDFKKVSEKKREENDDAIESLADAIVEGVLVLKSDKRFVQTLLFPIGDEGAIKTLTYKPRIKMSEVEARSQKVKPGDTQGIIRGYICALTEQAAAIIKELDTEDNRISRSIATFFL